MKGVHNDQGVIRRVIATVGPWPIRPFVLGGSLGFVFLTAAVASRLTEPLMSRDFLFPLFLPAIGITLLVTGIAWVGRRWQQRFGVKWGSYLTFLVAMALVIPVLRALVPGLPDLPNLPLGPGPFLLRTLIPVFLISAVIGNITQSLEVRIAQLDEALALSRQQQMQLIEADEEARRQVAVLLHDRVQAVIITIGMELREFAKKLPADRQRELAPLVERLEVLRVLDVRGAARALSPNLEELDLQTALEEMCIPYEARLDIDLQVDSGIETERDRNDSGVLLACYRIIEQALINVAAHAQATKVVIEVVPIDDGVSIRVTDDGRGLAGEVNPGLGSTVITTWTRAFEGEWRLRPGQSRGAILEAELRRMEPLGAA